ncbi:MAG: hypothetical protein ACOYN4_01790 [Bacteroidales bacterium]
MKRISLKLFVATLLTCLSFSAFSQNYSEQAKMYFGKTLESNSIENLCIASLPTIDDCKLIFIGTSAYTFFGFIEDIKSKMKDTEQRPSKTYVEVRVESFTSNDVVQGKDNYPGGMKEIAGKLQPGVTFYKIEYLKEKGAESGLVYNCWAKIDNRWVYFPKPWKVLKY